MSKTALCLRGHERVVGKECKTCKKLRRKSATAERLRQNRANKLGRRLITLLERGSARAENTIAWLETK